eukprot:5207616-Amphidinium_carterae.1
MNTQPQPPTRSTRVPRCTRPPYNSLTNVSWRSWAHLAGAACARLVQCHASGTDKKCLNWKHKPAFLGTVLPERCGALLDEQSHHAQVCCKFLRTRRHHAIRNLLQRHATEAGYTALAEQFALSATTCPDMHFVTQVSTKRGLERADLHLVSPDGADMCIDLRITPVFYFADVMNHPAEQEKQKRQQYVRAAVKPVIIGTRPPCSRRTSLFSQLTTLHIACSKLAACRYHLGRATFQCTPNAFSATQHNLDAQGKIALTLASSRAEQHAFCSPEEPITASHAAQLQPLTLLHQSTSAAACSTLPPLSAS